MTYALPTVTPPIRLRELPASEHPRQRLATHGAAALSDTELLTLILGAESLDLAQRLLARWGDVAGLRRASCAQLQACPGVGPTRAAQLLAALELTARHERAALAARPQITGPQDVAALLMAEMGHLQQEQMRVVCLNTKGYVLGMHTLYTGTIDTIQVRAAEVYRPALEGGASSIILAHGHPSGDPMPSPEDLSVTRQLINAGKLLSVLLLDHLVIAQRRWVSIRSTAPGYWEG